MKKLWVVDASLGLAWVHPAQATEQTNTLLQELKGDVHLVVPALWFQEMANALLVLERRKRINANERREALSTLQALGAKPDLEGALLAFGRISELAEVHGLSVYDATYLELALREQVPLGTKDEALQAAAKQHGVSLLLS
jgi:predicted nucleic acid-binding protein